MQKTDKEVIAAWIAYSISEQQHGHIDGKPHFITYYKIKEVPLNSDGHDNHWQYALPFDSDWSWLMPVWYKFRDLKIDGAYSDTTISEVSKLQRLKGEIGRAILRKGPSPSEACHLLAEGIRWYNSIKQ
jgi:hypothetical protein